MKLFTVEDEFKIREELKILLESEGYQVEALSSFQNIVQDIIQQDYDLLLLDINLPNENGFMICKEVKKHKQTPIIFVIIIAIEAIIVPFKNESFLIKSPYSKHYSIK